MKTILDEIIRLLQSGDEDLPPLYVRKDDMESADFITKFITSKAGSGVELKVFPITKLLQELIQHGESALADALMEQDPYSHHPGLGCDIHEGLNRASFCSLSICKRNVFTLLRATSMNRNFKLM